MKIFLLKSMVTIFKFLSCPFLLLPIENKITILSRIDNVKTLDITILEKELKKQFKNYEIVILTDYLEKGIKGILKYLLKMPKYLFNIYTSKLVICDSYIPAVSLTFKKKETKIVQMWHAMGAYKQFGYSILDKYEGSPSEIAKVLKMHKNYDYVLASSEYSKEKFSEAFNIDENKFIISLLPKCSYLKENNEKFKKQILNNIKDLNNNKINILYAPTFRKSKRNYMTDIIDCLDYEKYNLIIKNHKGHEVVYVDNKKIYEEKRKYDLKLLSVSDIVITDYSAITFEAMLANKPVYFYVPDYDEYMNERGIYEKIEDGKYYKNVETLLKNIDTEPYLSKEKYVDETSVSLADILNKIIKGEI